MEEKRFGYTITEWMLIQLFTKKQKYFPAQPEERIGINTGTP